MVDSLVKKCMGTGKVRIFYSKTSPSFDGNIHCDEVCKNYAPLPDLGWYVVFERWCSSEYVTVSRLRHRPTRHSFISQENLSKSNARMHTQMFVKF